ncbi:uncharacterized protein LOC132062316 [Lycium ferocissimum]|uniref:uncharacterized protein LOC132062316 n=1 Tax=Lycium ferocissimum TaxID=112874 RepID=UPI002815AD2C|nr:uncharacterized protein LOC132062316 [Lycium ferocissimum]
MFSRINTESMAAASLGTMLSFSPNYTPPAEYVEPPTVKMPRHQRPNVPRPAARGRGRQSGNRRGRGPMDHHLVDEEEVHFDQDMPSPTMPAADDAYYLIIDFGMSCSSTSAPEVQSPAVIRSEGPFQAFASSEPISLAVMAQQFGVRTGSSYGMTEGPLPAFTGQSSSIGRRLSFTDDAGVLQEEVHQRRSKRERRQTQYGTGGGGVERDTANVFATKYFNLGTVVEWEHQSTTMQGEHIFKFLFWAYKPSIDGFKSCGCHLNSRYSFVRFYKQTYSENFSPLGDEAYWPPSPFG